MVTDAQLFAEAWSQHQAGALAQAEELYRRVLSVNPNHVDAVCFLGAVCEAVGKSAEAEAGYRRAIRLAPRFATAHNCLAVLLAKQGKRVEAIASFREALRYAPNDAEIHYNLGLALNEEGEYQAAETEFREALKYKPDYVEALNDLGLALRGQEKLREALSYVEYAIRIRPDNAKAHWNRSLLCLLTGNFKEGWPAYEWRWTQPDFIRRHHDRLFWDGSDLRGKSILVHAEQGLGDTFQFIRYLPLVKERGGRLIFECQPSLTNLLVGFPGIDCLVAQGLPLPPFDMEAPLLSLPGLFRTTLQTIPSRVPYLRAAADLVSQWRQELRPHSVAAPRSIEFLVGIAWQGNPTYKADRLRSIPAAEFAPLAEVEGVRLISLQKGSGVSDQGSEEWRAKNTVDFGDRLDGDHGAFMDTAAIMMNLDLVISSDSAVAHLAGALGVPVWVALPKVADWRWLLERSNSPWYPTMRLFRQSRHGRWDDVFREIAAELRKRLKTRD